MYNYRHGGNVHAEPNGAAFLDFSVSVNPLGPPRQVEEAIRDACRYLGRYPENGSKELRERIAGFEGVPPDWIFCGNGSSDIIFRLPRCVKAKTGLVPIPTFSDYARALESCGSKVYRLCREENNDFIGDEYFSNQRADILFLCNPNNPTGLLTPVDRIEELLRRCEESGTTVAIDECFMDFCENAAEATAKSLSARFRNLVLIKAVTKTFALPGIRLGYAVCSNTDLIDRLYFCGPDWPVSCLAQAAGIAALKNAGPFLKITVDFVANERVFVKRELESFGFHVLDGRANFLLARNPFNFDLKQELDERSIRVRSFAADEGLDSGYFRIGLSSRENNQRLLQAVGEIVRSKGAKR